ncbi:MAG: hypothetical protein U0900_14225 [Myxococcota bacterium]
MDERSLQVVVRTPQAVVLDEGVSSLRIPTSTGQVGLRPRSEATVLVVEPGLVLMTGPSGRRFVATAGGLLHCDGLRVVLLTPVAVIGDGADSVRAALKVAFERSAANLELRAVLQRLETGILQELRRGSSESSRGAAHG